MSELGDKLRGAAGGGGHAYGAADVERAASKRRLRRRAARGMVAAFALVGGIALALNGQNESSTLDIVGDGTTSTTTTTEAPTSTTTPEPLAAAIGECTDRLPNARQLQSAGMSVTVVDLDGDRLPEGFLYAPGADGGGWLQVVRGSDGAFSNPIFLEGLVPGGWVHAADVDGDGMNEAFLPLAGNTLLTGVIIELEGCTLRAVTSDDPSFDYGDGLFTYPYSSGGNGCAPTGCHNSVVCATGEAGIELRLTQIRPVRALDPSFDPAIAKATPWDELSVVVDTQTVRIRDGVAETIEKSTAVTDAGSGFIEPLWLLPEVSCDAVGPGAEGCSATPTLSDRFNWFREFGEFDDAPARWMSWLGPDNQVVHLSSPGRVMAGDGDMGDVVIDGRTARIGSNGSNSRVGPHLIMWNLSDDDDVVFCERWTLWSNDLGPVELAEFAADVLGAGAVEWFGPEPAPYLTDEEVLSLGETLLEELLAWGSGDGPAPTSLRADSVVEQFFLGVRLRPIPSDELFTNSVWTASSEGEWPGFIPESMKEFDQWDVVLGPHPFCGVPARVLAMSPPAVHQLSFEPAEGSGPKCEERWISIGLFLHGDGTVHTIRIHLFEP